MMKRLLAAGSTTLLACILIFGPGVNAQELVKARPFERVAVTDRFLYVLLGDQLYAYDASSQKQVSATVVPGLHSQAVAGARGETRTTKSKAGKHVPKDLALQGLEKSADSGNPTGEHARKARAKARQKAREWAPQKPEVAPAAGSESTGPAGPQSTASGDAVGTGASNGTSGTMPQLVANGRMVFVVNRDQIHTFEAGTLRFLGSRPLSFQNSDSTPGAEAAPKR